MQHQDNRAISAQAIDAINRRDWIALAQVMDQSLVDEYASSDMHIAFPDIAIHVDAQYVDGEYVTTRWTTTGTHLGPFQGLPPTHRRIHFTGIAIDHIVEGTIVETWKTGDMLSLFEQLGWTLQPPVDP